MQGFAFTVPQEGQRMLVCWFCLHLCLLTPAVAINRSSTEFTNAGDAPAATKHATGVANAQSTQWTDDDSTILAC